MKTAELITIDTHTHLEVSCRNPFDSYGEELRANSLPELGPRIAPPRLTQTVEHAVSAGHRNKDRR